MRMVCICGCKGVKQNQTETKMENSQPVIGKKKYSVASVED